MRLPVASAIAFTALLLASATAVAQPPTQAAKTWAGCCGLAPWPPPGPLKVTPNSTMGPLGGYGYVVGGSPLRHHLGLTGQIPAAYAALKNPLPPTPRNAQLGAAVYDENCASCHGAGGLGDGPASRTATPPPAHLGWLTKIPPSKRDAFIYWSVVDGGTRFKTAMPSYKGKLSDDQIWSVIGYIEARLPHPAKTAR